MEINTMAFCKKYQIDNNGKYGHCNSGKCMVCGKDTTQVDAALLWDGIATYLCSDNCYAIYWKEG